MPWVPGPADSEDRMTRLLVALRGYSTEGGRGGLIGRLSELVEDVEAALAAGSRMTDGVDLADDGAGADDEEPGYLVVLRESRLRRGESG